MVSYGYARVSTTGQSHLIQVARLVAAGVPEENIFTDKASGMRASRPGWDALMAALEEGDVLKATNIDRIGRSLKNLLEVFEDLDARGISVVLLDQALDTSSREGRLMLHLMMVIAEYLRVLLLDRTAEGRAEALAAGQKFGRPPALDDRGIARARALVAQGFTYTEAGAALGVSRKTIARRVAEG
jgi:DNA invertase Pin-like site-specific DNA recombinase